MVGFEYLFEKEREKAKQNKGQEKKIYVEENYRVKLLYFYIFWIFAVLIA